MRLVGVDDDEVAGPGEIGAATETQAHDTALDDDDLIFLVGVARRAAAAKVSVVDVTALEELVTQKRLELQSELVKRAGSSIHLEPEEARAKEQIETAFAAASLTVPTVKEVLNGLPVEAKHAEKILQILLRDKILVRITPELIFHRDTLARLKERLLTYKKTKSERISVPVFKELTGITRKYAIPLLEYLDRERITRRAGDERVIL